MAAIDDRVYAISVTGAETTKKDPTVYLLEIRNGSTTWKLAKRYSEMKELHDGLIKERVFELPAFPPKKTVGNKSAKFIEQRRMQLDDYVKAVAAIIGVPSTAVFRAFFEVEGKEAAPATGGSNAREWMVRYEQAARDVDDLFQQIVALKDRARRGEEGGATAAGIRVRATNITKSLRGLEEQLSLLDITDAERKRRRDMARQIGVRVEQARADLEGGAPPDARAALMGEPGAAGGRRRGKWGAVEEDEETLGLDNRELLELQKQTMANQDEGLSALSAVLDRTLQMGRAIGTELDEQNALLDHLDSHVEHTETNIRVQSKKIQKML